MTSKLKDVEELIMRVGELPPIPKVAEAALAEIRKPTSNMAELAQVLSLDQALAGLVLRWANSAYYGLSDPVSTVQQAVVYLGQRTVQNLILAGALASFMDRPIPGYGLDRGALWSHSIAVAGGARMAASRFGSQTAEEAYLAGLLCDIGKLAFEVLLRDVTPAVTEWEGREFHLMEKERFGIDHASLGGEIARKWMLPEALVDAIINHHQPSNADEGFPLVDAVHLADCAATMAGAGIGHDGLKYVIDPGSLDRLGWTAVDFHNLLERITSLVNDAEAFLRVRRQ